MDAGYDQDLAGRLYGLLIGLDDCIGSEQVRLLHHFIEVGEYGLALEEMAWMLAQDTIAVTGQERGDMLGLAAQMKLEGDIVPRRRLARRRKARSAPHPPTGSPTGAPLDLGRGACHLPDGEGIPGGAAEGVPGDGERVGHVSGQDSERDGDPVELVSGASAELRRDLRRRRCPDCRRSARARPKSVRTASPGTPAAAAARNGEPHRIALLLPGPAVPLGTPSTTDNPAGLRDPGTARSVGGGSQVTIVMADAGRVSQPEHAAALHLLSRR